MTEKEIIAKMTPGEFNVGHSSHRYGKKTGYEWMAKTPQGTLKRGVEKDKERAYALAEYYAFHKGG